MSKNTEDLVEFVLNPKGDVVRFSPIYTDKSARMWAHNSVAENFLKDETVAYWSAENRIELLREIARVAISKADFMEARL
jgi:hypothetical protein